MKKKTARKAPRKSRKVTLNRVASKAMADREFWKQLRDDPRRALAANGLALAPADSRRLRAIMALDGKTLRVDLDRLMRARSRVGPAGILSWIGGLWSHPQVILEPRQPRSKKS